MFISVRLYTHTRVAEVSSKQRPLGKHIKATLGLACSLSTIGREIRLAGFRSYSRLEQAYRKLNWKGR